MEQSIHQTLLGEAMRRTRTNPGMKLSKNTLFVAVIVAVTAFSLFLTRKWQIRETGVRSGMSSSKWRDRFPATITAGRGREALQALMDSQNHPIALYGKVVDQFGEAVPGATVEIFLYPVSTPNGSGSDGGVRTDQDGKFSITGLRGSSLGASAMKDGYLRVPPLNSFSSSVSLDFNGEDGSGDRHANPSNPVILKLLKVGPVEPMIHIRKKRWKLPLDGTPKMIALDSEEGRGVHQIEFRFLSDTHIRSFPGNDAATKFDWSFEIRVPGGELAWDESDVRFEAPKSGYREMVRYAHSGANPSGEWKRVQEGRYFVKFPDETFGRVQFSIDGGSDRRPLYMESWLNLKPGSRNLATENMVIKKMESKEPEN